MVLPITNPTKSFWIEAGESKLGKNFRSTAELPKEVDVVIIGSGYTGASMAYWLHKYAGRECPSMLMLEARDICGGATGRNGGQLRPHLYSRWPAWSGRFGTDTAYHLIQHEAAHLDVFPKLLAEEGITEEVCFKAGSTHDAAMSTEAWVRLKKALDDMREAKGADDVIVKSCRVIEDKEEAERVTQMKGCIKAIVHPSAQIWPYKFVHALLRILLEAGQLNLQANTPALKVSPRGADGYITVETARGSVRTRAVVHATNRWAGHLIPDIDRFILPGRGTLGVVKAPEGFLGMTGAQHWNDTINNYHLQLPAPYNHLVLGGMRPVTTHAPENMVNDREDIQFPGGPEYCEQWAESDILGWQGKAEFAVPADKGGVWTGVWGTSVDAFPLVGQVPNQPAQFVAAAFTGHGMPRILLTTANLAPLVLDQLGIKHHEPASLANAPPLPEPFKLTPERIEELKKVNVAKLKSDSRAASLRGAKLEVCQKFKRLAAARL